MYDPFSLLLLRCRGRMDQHDSYLQQMCRVGGKRFSTCSQSTRYAVKSFETELLSVFEIDISHDDPDIHPPYLCILCQKVVKRSSSKSTFCGGGCGAVHDWQEHHRISCTTCSLFAKQSKGGRAPRRMKSQRQTAQLHADPDALVNTTQQSCILTTAGNTQSGLDKTKEDIYKLALPIFKAQSPLTSNRFTDKSVEECGLCSNVVDNAVQTACCEELLCARCIWQWLSGSSICPVCSCSMKASSLRKPCALLQRIIGNWSLHCDYHAPALQGCQAVVQLKNLQKHTQACTFNPSVSSTPCRAITPSSSVADILTASPSKLSGNIAEQLTSHLVTSRVKDGRLEIRPGSRGRAQVYSRTTVSNVPSGDASSSTQRRRSSELRHVQHTVCGGSDGARAQEVAGLERLSRADQEKLLQEAGIRPLTPGAGTLLAIKADLNLPWSQIRKLKQWLNDFGLQLEPEKVARSFIATHIPKYVVKEVPMVKRSGEVIMASMIFFPSLLEIVMHYLSLYDKQGSLTWRGDVIPEDQVWIKLGGDHGGGSFKFVMQVANLDHPNSLNNTIPICTFDCQDTAANLETALGQYRDQIKELMTCTWMGKSMVIFFFGDYEYQTKSYGISGASGYRPCLHCLCPKKDMNTDPDLRPARAVARTLDLLASDHDRYVAAGSPHQLAKAYNNVVRPSIFPIPVENAIIPVLHLDLGIFKTLFQAMEGEVRTLDLQVAVTTTTTDEGAAAFRQLSEMHDDQRVTVTAQTDCLLKIEEAKHQLEYTTFYSQHAHNQDYFTTAIAQLQTQLQELTAESQRIQAKHQQQQQEIAKLESNKQFSGPCFASIEPVLQKHKVQRQAYHGGAFVGNHIHRVLQPHVIAELIAAPTKVVAERCPQLQEAALEIQNRYSSLLSGYASCRKHFGHCLSLSEDDVKEFQSSVKQFLSNCRVQLVERKLAHITPRLHLLEEHTVTAIERFHVGLGLLAEQGSESIHAKFNSLDRDYNSIPNRLKRLQAVAEQHLVSTLPQHASLCPSAESRKRKASSQLFPG